MNSSNNLNAQNFQRQHALAGIASPAQNVNAVRVRNVASGAAGTVPPIAVDGLHADEPNIQDRNVNQLNQNIGDQQNLHENEELQNPRNIGQNHIHQPPRRQQQNNNQEQDQNQQAQQLDNHNWQSLHPSVKERITFLFNNEVLSDVHFLLGKATGEMLRVPAHKFILSIGSVVFNAMFNGGFAVEPYNEIEIPDIEPASFLSLLKFLYTDEVSIGPDTVMSTLYAAKKYAVPTLEQKCVDFLKRNLGPDNAFTLLSQARLFDEPQLTDLCLNCIDKSTVDSFDAEGFTDIDVETLKSVLQRDSLSARESQLFDAVVRWADHECRRKDIANTALNKRYQFLISFNLFVLFI